MLDESHAHQGLEDMACPFFFNGLQEQKVNQMVQTF
jgi:hypothetical protein